MAEVGPVFEATPVARILVEILIGLNPKAQVIDRGSYLRIAADGECKLTREKVKSRLGDSFNFPRDLELIMPSFQGRMRMGREEVVWYE